MNQWKAEWQKIRGMSRQDARWYIWEYYKIHIMFLAIGIFFLVLIIQANFGHRQETVLAVYLVDTDITQEQAETANSVYMAKLALNPQDQQVVMDAGIQVEGGTVASLQKLLVSVAAKEVDVLLSDADITDYLMKGGALSDLSVVLPDEVLAQYRERLIYVDAAELSAWTESNRAGEAEAVVLLHQNPDGMTTPVPVAVDVTEGCEAFYGRPAEYGTVLFSVAVTTQHREASAEFLTDLLEVEGEGNEA